MNKFKKYIFINIITGLIQDRPVYYQTPLNL